MTSGKKRPPTATPATDEEPFEFRIGRPEFRVGAPEFRIGHPPKGAEPEPFVIGGPPPTKDRPAKPADEEFVIGGPLPSRRAPSLPAGWEPVPRQPDWTLAPTPDPNLVRVDKPKPRYRGLKPLKTTIPDDLAEEIVDMLVYRAARGNPQARSMAEFIRTAVARTLMINRSLDQFADRYPNYGDQGIVPKRGRRVGSSAPDRDSMPSRDIVLRAPAALVDEVNDLVIHRNGGTADGPATVSAFVAHAIDAALSRTRRDDAITRRYPPTGPEERLTHLDARSATGNPEAQTPDRRKTRR